MAVAPRRSFSDAVRPAGARRAAALRVAVVAAPVLYLIGLGVTIASWGLPIARDQLFFWLALGLVAFSVGRWRSWPRLALEWAPFFGLLVLYDVLRGAVAVAPERAHYVAQIDADRALFGRELPTVWLQRHLWDGVSQIHWYDYLAWATYMTHFFAVWVVAAVLWSVAHERFRRYVALTVLLTLAAFLTYWLYPAQPPWLSARDGDIGSVSRIVPEVWGRLGVGTVGSVYENSAFVNPVAAMPSLHAAYPCMLLLFFWDSGRRVRAAFGLYTIAMGTTLVYSGEHYVLDILVGWAMAGGAFALVGAASRLRTPTEAPLKQVRSAG